MSYNADGPELELKLHLSPPGDHRRAVNGSSISSTEISPRSSCVSREASPDEASRATSQIGSMMLVGCPRCLMYVMLMEDDPKCPKCKSTVLLDFLREDRSMTINRKKLTN